jgi:uncharacterized caspase-like protein
MCAYLTYKPGTQPEKVQHTRALSQALRGSRQYAHTSMIMSRKSKQSQNYEHPIVQHPEHRTPQSKVWQQAPPKDLQAELCQARHADSMPWVPTH